MEKKSYIHETAKINNSKTGRIKAFRNSVINNSNLADGCSVGDDTTIDNCTLGSNVAVNRRCYVNDSIIGDYTYMGINTTMNFTKIGKFCSLARNVDIGGFDHDYRKVTTMPAFRFKQMLNGGGKIPEKTKHTELCEIGNDVWIAAGAQILHKVKIGDGAVVGGGAVVTKDVPPYAIVAGVPAKIIGYRCSEKYIEILEKIKWWDWPEAILSEVMDELMNRDIDDETMAYLESIYKTVK